MGFHNEQVLGQAEHHWVEVGGVGKASLGLSDCRAELPKTRILKLSPKISTHLTGREKIVIEKYK